MNKKFFVISYSLLVIGGIALPFVASAISMPSIWPTGYWGSFVSCGGINCNSQGLCGLVQVLLNVVAFGISIVFFILAPIFFTWGGIKILTSSGNPTGLEEGKKIFKGTLIGVLLVLAGFLIVKTLVTTLNVGDFIQGFTGGISCN